MSVRWRKDGKLVCAAKSEEETGDCYIDDRLHYELAVVQKVLVPCHDEDKTGEWRWLYGESVCDCPNRKGCFIRAESFEE